MVLNTTLNLNPILFLTMGQSLLLCILQSIDDHFRQINKQMFLQQIPASARHRKDRGVPLLSLQNPTYSHFMILILSKTDQVLITLSSFALQSLLLHLDQVPKLHENHSLYFDTGLIRKLQKNSKTTVNDCFAVRRIGIGFGKKTWFGNDTMIKFHATKYVCSLFRHYEQSLHFFH